MRGAIFDMDGLLLDTERVFQETWYEMAAELGVTLDRSFTPAISGICYEASLEVVAKYLPMTDPTAFIREGTRRVFQKEEAGISLKPGVISILEGMREQGIRRAVASSSGPEMVRRNLRIAGIKGFFEIVVSGKEVPKGKPAPDIFLHAAKLLGLPPEECWVFEDSINGVRAGLAAGCSTVMIPDLVRPTEELLAAGARVFSDLGAAWNAIRKDCAAAEPSPGGGV